MKRLLNMTRANIKMSFRARQTLFWTLAFPIIILVLFSFAFGKGSGFSVTVGVVGNSSTARIVQGALKSINGVTLKTGSQSSELGALKNGDRDAVLVIPAGTPLATNPLPISLYYDQTNLTQSSAVVSLVSQIVTGLNQRLTHERDVVVVRQQGIATVNTNYINFLAPGIIAMSVMTSCISGVAARMAVWREQRVLKRLRATPLSTWEFVGSNVLSQLVIVLAQVLILTGLATTLLGVHLAGSLLLTIGLAFLGGMTFLTIGFTISGLAKTADAASAIANVVTLPMMFLSGVYFSVSGSPDWLKPFINILPLTYLANALRDVMLHGKTLSNVLGDVVALLITAAIGFVVASRTFRWE